MAIMEGAEPFLLPGDDRGILLIHGFTGSPAEVRLLGDFLHKQGYTVIAPRLCGHGTRVEDLSKIKWHQWYSGVEDAYHLLKGICHTVTVIGLSMGGLLAFALAAEYHVDTLISLSTPIYIVDKRIGMLPLYRIFREYIPKKRRKYTGISPLYTVGYNATPLSSLSSLLELIGHVEGLLPTIHLKILIIQGHHDHTVQARSAQYIYDQVGSLDKEIIWLKKSGHIVTLDIERETVFRQIAKFLDGSNKGGPDGIK